MSRCLLLLLIFCTSCYRVQDTLEPKISSVREQQHVLSQPSPFSSLSREEKNSDWGREYSIALAFAKEYDLYRAISTFKRAKVLIDKGSERSLEIDYFIIYCYYLAKKYEEALITFETSPLIRIDPTFSAYEDLLIILHESYLEIGNEEKSEHMLDLLDQKSPSDAKRIYLSDAISHGEIDTLAKKKEEYLFLDPLLLNYTKQKKSVGKAQFFNAIFPGAGYMYVGLYKSAFTSLMLNSLFIYASYYFFHTGHLAAGAITLSFEMGWYFGGIYGAGEQAKYYNERIYEKLAYGVMNRENLFPVLMLKWGF